MASTTKETIEKSELIARLTTVQEGFATIAQQSRIVENAEEEVKEFQDSFDEACKEYSETVQKLETKKAECEDRLDVINKKAKAFSSKRDNIEGTKPKNYANLSIGWIIGCILFITFGMSTMGIAMGSSLEPVVMIGVCLELWGISIFVVLFERNKRGKRGSN